MDELSAILTTDVGFVANLIPNAPVSPFSLVKLSIDDNKIPETSLSTVTTDILWLDKSLNAGFEDASIEAIIEVV